jgi:hypothetical protein
MAVFRVEKSKDYTVMSNYHLRDSALSLKAKGLLSQMLSLPEGWDYTLSGLAQINREGVAAIRTAVEELEEAGYIVRRQTTGEDGKFSSNEYVIHEQPVCDSPLCDFPITDNPSTEKPLAENQTQLNIDISSKDISKRKSKKEKPPKEAAPELTLEDMKPLIVENIRKMSQGRSWTADVKNQIYTALIDFYSPRPIKGKKDPPTKSSRGLNGLCNKLMRESKQDPLVILAALDEGAYDRVIIVQGETIMPTLYREQLEGLFGKISSYTTKTTKDKDRNTNIELSAAALNGRVVLPGQSIAVIEVGVKKPR